MNQISDTGPALVFDGNLRSHLEHIAAGTHGRPGQRAAVRLLSATGLIGRPQIIRHLHVVAHQTDNRWPSPADQELRIDWPGLTADPDLQVRDENEQILLESAIALDTGAPIDLGKLATVSGRFKPAALGAYLGAGEHAEVVAARRPEFDFYRDVIGEDIVAGGVVYSAAEYTDDGDNGVRKLTDREVHTAYLDRLASEAGHLAEQLLPVSGAARVETFDVLGVLDRLLRGLETMDFEHGRALSRPPRELQCVQALDELGWQRDGDGYAHPDLHGAHVRGDLRFPEGREDLCLELALVYEVSPYLVRLALAVGRPEAVAAIAAANRSLSRELEQQQAAVAAAPF